MFQFTPSTISETLKLFNDTFLSALYNASIRGTLQDVEEIEKCKKKKKLTRSKKRKNVGEQNDDENQGDNEEKQVIGAYLPLGVTLCKSMCEFLSNCVSLGLIRPSQPDIDSHLSQFVYGLIQKQRMFKGNGYELIPCIDEQWH